MQSQAWRFTPRSSSCSKRTVFQANLGYIVRPEGAGVLDGVKISLICVCVSVLFFVLVYSYLHVSILLLQCYYFSHFIEGKNRLEGFEK